MLEFKITINTDNAAFDPDPTEEVDRLLELCLEEIRSWGLEYELVRPLHDISGNLVGHLTMYIR